jgi:hypothetical protein
LVRQVIMASRVLGFAFRDTWQEFWTILIVHLLFLLANLLILPGPPATLALFFYGNRIVHGETADERDFLNAARRYWGPAWQWGSINLAVVGLLLGDYYLTGRLAGNSSLASFLQGLYIALLAGWLLLQLFTLPFLFEQEQPSVPQALRNAAIFLRRNVIFAVVLALLLGLSLAVGVLTFMLTFAFGGALVAFAGNRAVLKDLAEVI